MAENNSTNRSVTHYLSLTTRDLPMADASNVPQTPYAVAFELARAIAFNEGMPLGTGQTGDAVGKANKIYLLSLYRECLAVVGSQGAVFSKGG